MNPVYGRMQREHVTRVGIDQGVDLGCGNTGLERGENGRSQQHIAVMAQLDNQNPPDAAQIYGVS